MIIQVLINGLMIGAVYALIAMGLSLIFGITRIINFAHGEFLMISMYFVFFATKYLGGSAFLYLLPTVCMLFFIGFGTERWVLRHAEKARSATLVETNQLLLTYGLAIILQNLALMLFTPNYRTIASDFSSSSFFFSDYYVSWPKFLAFLICIFVAGLLFLFLRKTRLGKAMRATASHRVGAEIVGVDTRRIASTSFGLGLALVAIGGGTMMSYMYVYPGFGGQFTIFCFMIVVLGGMGSIIGTFIAGLMTGLIESAVVTWIAGDLPMLFFFIMFLLAVFLRPQGLLGKKERVA